jgi:hypothetical protein
MATAFGAFVGLVLATPVLWVANARATDGPNFPPALLAFGFLVLPASVILLVIQLGLLAASRWTGGWSGRNYLVIGPMAGVPSGALLIKMLGTPISEPVFRVELLSFGVAQSLATFSCYAYASRRQWI